MSLRLFKSAIDARLSEGWINDFSIPATFQHGGGTARRSD